MISTKRHVGWFLLLATGLHLRGQAVTFYEPIPESRDFPVRPEVIEKWLGFGTNILTGDDPYADPAGNGPTTGPIHEGELRHHVWRLLELLTHPSHVPDPGGTAHLARWETWYPRDFVFSKEGNPLPKLLPRLFSSPDQFIQRELEENSAAEASPPAQPVDPKIDLSTEVLFNWDAAHHIRDKQLYLKATLADHLSKAPLDEFPERAVALKTAWMRVSKEGCTVIPVWDGEPRDVHVPANGKDSWVRNVTVRMSPGGDPNCAKWPEKSIDLFFHHRIPDKSTVKGIPNLQDGDYIVLVGLHVATREIRSWIWATFWWHDRPNEGRFSEGRPGTVKSPWNSYLMDTAYDMDRPWQSDARPKATFNPYLEAQFDSGTRSNCMTCHRRAVYPFPSKRATLDSFGSPAQFNQIIVSGSEAAKATYFPEYGTSLKTNFLWSIVMHAQ